MIIFERHILYIVCLTPPIIYIIGYKSVKVRPLREK